MVIAQKKAAHDPKSIKQQLLCALFRQDPVRKSLFCLRMWQQDPWALTCHMPSLVGKVKISFLLFMHAYSLCVYIKFSDLTTVNLCVCVCPCVQECTQAHRSWFQKNLTSLLKSRSSVAQGHSFTPVELKQVILRTEIEGEEEEHNISLLA